MKIDIAFKSINRLFLDTGALIYYVDANPKYLALMDYIFNSFEVQKIRAVTSPITLAECLVIPIKEKDLVKQQKFIDILTLPEMADFININAEISIQASELRVKYNLKLPDALQIATAISSGCEAFLTNDKQLSRVSELQVIVIDELEI
jgi:predicted nucleic acid-binding protein